MDNLKSFKKLINGEYKFIVNEFEIIDIEKFIDALLSNNKKSIMLNIENFYNDYNKLTIFIPETVSTYNIHLFETFKEAYKYIQQELELNFNPLFSKLGDEYCKLCKRYNVKISKDYLSCYFDKKAKQIKQEISTNKSTIKILEEELARLNKLLEE